ncbi:MAG TPA: hypothetical protein VM575_07670, partial [Nocardioides sp.]|nr:hypothetical protein [Nocardioides sp.]
PGPSPAPDPAPDPATATVPPVAAAPPTTAAAPEGGGLTLVDIRRLWPSVIDRVKGVKRVTWIHLTQNSQVVGFDNDVIALGFQADGPRRSFESGGHADIVQQAVIDEIGAAVRIDAIIDPAAVPGGAPPPSSAPPSPAAPAAAPRQAAADDGWGSASATPPADDPPPWAVPGNGQPVDAAPAAPAEPTPRRTRMADIQAREEGLADGPPEDPDAHARFDDADVDAESSADLLARELGAQMIEEIPRGS